jgi:replicative DNA helicase
MVVMASPEHLLISKVIQTSDISTPIKAGLKFEHLTGAWSEVWMWLTEFYRTHGTVPTPRVFKTQYADIQLYDAEAEPFSRLIDEIFQAHTQHRLVEVISEVMPLINEGKTKDALEHLSSGVQTASVEVSRMRDVDIIQNWESRVARYEEMRNTPNALRGIPTGFYGLDRITSGLRPQQYIVFVGEPKRGKSLFALIIANSCHVHGKTPMFVSFEMSIEEQEARYDAIISKTPYNKILRGDLTKTEMERISKALRVRKNMQPFIFSEDTSSLTTISALMGKAKEYQPDLLVVDGVYLMDDEEGEPKGSPQALTNITRGLKRMAQKLDIPIVSTTQALSWKLNNKKTRAITADAIGYSSSFVQDADLVLGVERNPDLDDQAIIRVVAARTAPTGEVHIKWDWENMDFSEVTADGYGVGDAFD